MLSVPFARVSPSSPPLQDRRQCGQQPSWAVPTACGRARTLRARLKSKWRQRTERISFSFSFIFTTSKALIYVNLCLCHLLQQPVPLNDTNIVYSFGDCALPLVLTRVLTCAQFPAPLLCNKGPRVIVGRSGTIQTVIAAARLKAAAAVKRRAASTQSQPAVCTSAHHAVT